MAAVAVAETTAGHLSVWHQLVRCARCDQLGELIRLLTSATLTIGVVVVVVVVWEIGWHSYGEL